MYFLFALTWSVGISVDEDGRKEVDGLPPHTLSHSLRVPLTLARTPTPYPYPLTLTLTRWTGCCESSTRRSRTRTRSTSTSSNPNPNPSPNLTLTRCVDGLWLLSYSHPFSAHQAFWLGLG